MEVGDTLRTILNDGEISTLPDNLVSKLSEYIEGLLKNISEVNLKLERQHVDLEDISIEHQASTGKVRALDSEVNKLSQENSELKSSAGILQNKKNELELALSNSESSLKGLSSVLEHREKEVCDLKAELSSLKERFSQQNKLYLDGQVKLIDLESSLTILQTQHERRVSECEQLNDEKNVLDSEKLALMRQINRLQIEKSTEISNYQHSVEVLKNDLVNAEQLVETYKKQCDSLSERLLQEQSKLKECRDNFIAADESHRQELATQKKLTQIYKDAEKKANDELKELHKTSADYKECFQQLTREHEEVLANKRLEIRELKDLLQSKDDLIVKLNSELSKMNELMQQSSESPDVTAELARLIKAGLTYSQLYHRYHQTADELTLQKAENARLNDCLDTLVKELDELKPKVIKLKSAHESSSLIAEKLSQQLSENLETLDAEVKQCNETKRLLVHHQRELQRFKMENQDLSTQVQILTKELHIAKGGRVSDDLPEVTSTTQGLSTADHVISTQLVAFRDIQELQKQNQQLRAALRELSNDQEQEELSSVQKLPITIQREIENYKQELAQLKQSRIKQEELVQSIIRQRDMYKMLVDQSALQESQNKASPKRATYEADDERLKALSAELNTIKDVCDKTKQDYMNCQREKLQVERDFQEKLDEQRKTLIDLQMTNAKLTTQLDYSLENAKVMEKNINGYKQEINALRVKSEQYSNLVAKNEALVSSLRQDLGRVQESSIKSDMMNQQLRNEVDLHKTSLRRLQADADSARKDSTLQLQMLSNLQTIKNSVEQANAEMKNYYQQRVEQTEAEKQVLQKQMEVLKQQMAAFETVHSTETAELNKRIEASYQEVANYRARIKLLEEQRSKMTSSTLLGDSALEQAGQRNAEMTEEDSQNLKLAHSEIETLKQQLRLTSEASEEYRQVADRLEQTLREQTAASQQLQETLESRCNQLQSDVDSLSAKVSDLTKMNDKIFGDKNHLENELIQTRTQLNSKVTELTTDLNVYKQKLENKMLIEAKAREDLQQSSILCNELTEKYQSELNKVIQLSEDINFTKKERDLLSNRVLELEADVMKVDLQLQMNYKSYEEQEAMNKTTKLDMERMISDQKQQNSLLHQQLEHMAVKQFNPSILLTAAEGGSNSNECMENVLELVRSLRKDKEVYEAKLELSEAECKRMQTKLIFIETELKTAQNALLKEKTQTDVDIQTKAQHAELLRKVEQINVLTDSNRLLRQEKDSMQPKMDALENEIAKMRADKVPLEVKLSELTEQLQKLESDKHANQAAIDLLIKKNKAFSEKSELEKEDLNKKFGLEREQLKQQISAQGSQIDKLNADLSSMSANVSEKSILSEKLKELQANISTLEQTITANKEELSKKDNLITELKKIGRKYKTQYNNLVSSKVAATGEPATESADERLKVEAEVSSLKEELQNKEAELQRTQSEKLSIKSQLEEANSKLSSLEQMQTADSEAMAKLKAELADLQENHKKLKELMKPLKEKIISQKQEIEAKNAELESLKQKNAQLESQMHEAVSCSNEYKARLKNLEERNTPVQISHAAPSGDVKIGNVKPMSSVSQVRTIEVRPYATQQQRQPTATVIPNIAEQQENTNVDDPLVVINSSTSISSHSGHPAMYVMGTSDTPQPNTIRSAQTSGIQAVLPQPVLTAHTSLSAVLSAIPESSGPQASSSIGGGFTAASRTQAALSPDNNEAESRVKRLRGTSDDDDNVEPSIKKTREAPATVSDNNEAVQVDDGSSRDDNAPEQSESSDQSQSQISTASATAFNVVTSRHLPTYTGSDADVVIIVSSDEEEDAQPSHLQESDGEEENVEDMVEEAEGYASDQRSDEEYEQEGHSFSGEIQGGYDDGRRSDDDDSNERNVTRGVSDAGHSDDELDNGDIIMVDEHGPGSGMVTITVSSTQPASNISRSLPPLAVSYQSQSSTTSGINDDGIVPSTPTLSLPNTRNDGFAVAIRSPNPVLDAYDDHQRSSEMLTEYGDLAQQATVLDDLPPFGDSEAGGNPSNEVEITEPTFIPQETEGSDLEAGTHSEEVSSSVVNEGRREPIRWSESSAQSDMPTSSSQLQIPSGRRARGRGGRITRPTFNKP